MDYRKINLELIVYADESDAVVAKWNGALDVLEEEHSIFGGGRAKRHAKEVRARPCAGARRRGRERRHRKQNCRRLQESHLIEYFTD